jgi:hypothetical protein
MSRRSPDRPPPRGRQRLTIPASALGALCLAACGALPGDFTQGKTAADGAAASSSSAAQAFSIPPQTLPGGRVDTPYPTRRLLAQGASTPLTWSLAAGQLPPGLALEEDGDLRGTPGAKGLFAFTVAATDGTTTATRALQLGIDVFGVTVTGTRFGGDAWSDEPVTLVSFGGSGTVTFTVADAQSGGRILASDGATAVYVPGSSAPTTGCTDLVRARDSGTGATFDVRLEVLPHPAEDLDAGFGPRDVWYVDTSRKHGAHPHPTDFDEVLAAVGLRGSDAGVNERAAFVVRRAMLRTLRGFYQGLPIEFPMDDPAHMTRPAPGSWLPGASNVCSVISVLHGDKPGLFGLAIQDSGWNETAENDTGASEVGTLGVFLNQALPLFAAAWNNTVLPARPVDAGDLEALDALVYGREIAGPRAEEIRRIAEGIARTAAVITAHEVAHSLGLQHSAPAVPGSLLNAVLGVSPSIAYHFTAADRAKLGAALPGVGRDSPAKPSSGLLPEGGIEACHVAPPFPWAVRVAQRK